MKKNYIMPPTQAQHITVGQLMTGSGTTTIEIGPKIGGSEKPAEIIYA